MQNNTEDGPKPASKKEVRKVLAASAIGTMIDWYDFSTYGSLAVILSVVFFPSHSALQSLLTTFLVFGLGYLARPVGGLFFGHFGDKIGRRTTFIVTLLGMGVGTFSIGLLPTYATAGATAGILLTMLRFVQGFFVGGEAGGGTSYVAESAPNKRRGLFMGTFSSAFPAGILLTDVVVLPLSFFMGKSGLESFGWRIPFLLSGVLVIFGLILRVRLSETPMFNALHKKKETSSNPIKEAFTRHPLQMTVIAILGITGSSATMGYVGAVYILVYMQSVLNVSYYTAYLVFLPGISSVVILDIVFGWLSDKVGRIPLFVLGLGLAASIEIPLFLAMGFAVNAASIGLMMLVVIMIEIPYAMTQGLQALIQSEMFPTRVRYTGVGFTWQMGLGLFGGFQTYVATFLLTNFGGVTYTASGAIAAVKYPWIGLLYTTIGCSMGIIVLAIFRKKLPKKGEDLWKEVATVKPEQVPEEEPA